MLLTENIFIFPCYIHIMPNEGPSTYLNLLIYITGTYLSSCGLMGESVDLEKCRVVQSQHEN